MILEAVFKEEAEMKADFGSGFPIGGKADYSIVANALKCTVSGEAVSITDVSPLEHNIGVKLSSDTIKDFTSVILIQYGENGQQREYHPQKDGVVSGVTSLYPTTILATDNENVIITAEYNRDVTTAIGEVHDTVKEISNHFNYEQGTANVVNPALLQKLGYRYDFADGVTQSQNATCFLTAEKIPFDGTKLSIVASPDAIAMIANGTSSPANPIAYIYYYGENGYISGKTFGFVNMPITNDVPKGTTSIHIYSSFENMPEGAICIRQDGVKEYVPYQQGKNVLCEECLPTQTKEQLDRLEQEALRAKEIAEQTEEGFNAFKNTNFLYGKKIVNMGDSIFGNARPPQDVSTYLQNLSGATVYNCAFGGCRMSSHNGHWDAFSMYRLADAIASGDFSLQDEALLYDDRTSYAEEPLALLKTLDFNNIDILTINYGTNDWSASKKIDSDTNAYDTDTFLGAFRYSLKKIQEAYPALKIVIVSVTWRCEFDAERNVTQDISTWGNYYGTLLGEFYDAQKNCSLENGLQFIDLFSLGINKYNATYYFNGTDGTHQNEHGRQLIAKKINNDLF